MAPSGPRDNCACNSPCGCPASALDPDRRISQYAHSAWRMQDGPFGSAPNTITQTTDGYVWIGTMSGISALTASNLSHGIRLEVR